ncbi:hypothetical protein MASR2M78_28420 [Treponema sp.]
MTHDELQATARLAHLDLSEEELSAALPSFERMLGYFAAMRAADEDEAKATALLSSLVSDPSSPLTAALRSDFNNNNNPPNTLPNNDLANALLNCGPAREDRFLVVPNVL